MLSEYKDLIITGDFNIHFNDPHCSDTKAFASILQTFGLTQHVSCPTHTSGNTLDYIITADNGQIKMTEPTPDYFISDHCFITTKVSMPKPDRPVEVINFRRVKNIDKPSFLCDLKKAIHKIMQNNATNINDLADI